MPGGRGRRRVPRIQQSVMRPLQIRPVPVLQDQLTALEAAATVCLADPDVKAVHKLRTQTRRVEAMLLLLALIPGLPEHAKPAAALSRALKRLRRAAGEVRDLDVHRKMLESFAGAEDTIAAGGPQALKPDQEDDSGPESLGREAASVTTSPEVAGTLHSAATELRQHMGKQRDELAAELQETLEGSQTKLVKAAKRLLTALAPATEIAVAADVLLRDAEALARRSGLLRRGKLKDLQEDELHTLRKDAKAARYLAETLPEDAALAAVADRLEGLQHLGGEWHDALEIARAARKHFGKAHELTATYRAQRDRKLEIYRAALGAAPDASAAAARGKRPAQEKGRSTAGKASSRKAAAA